MLSSVLDEGETGALQSDMQLMYCLGGYFLYWKATIDLY